MAKAFWLFSENDGGKPHLPVGFGGRTTCPGDIIRLQTAYDHKHLLVGGYAVADDNLIGETGEGHTHLVVKVNDTWQQVTRGTTSHDHPLNESGGNLIPDYFLLFVVCSNADAAAIASEAGCYPVVEAEVTVSEDGGISIGALDSTQWTAWQQTMWESRMLNILGVQLPSEIDRGKRLVKLFLGALLSRQTGEERGYRYGSL